MKTFKIPDNAFKEALEIFYPHLLNTSGDLIIEEAKKIKVILISEMGIKSLAGIEFFEKLESLEIHSNCLENLDVSKNKALKDLYCGKNKLTRLDVSNNKALRVLVCSFNNLTNLDVSKNKALEILACAYNKIKDLDVSKNKALTRFNFEGCGLKNPDIINIICDFK